MKLIMGLATGPNQCAFEAWEGAGGGAGGDRNSVYTAALLDVLGRRGGTVDVAKVLGEVLEQVMARTGRQQVPSSTFSIPSGDIFLMQSVAAVPLSAGVTVGGVVSALVNEFRRQVGPGRVVCMCACVHVCTCACLCVCMGVPCGCSGPWGVRRGRGTGTDHPPSHVSPLLPPPHPATSRHSCLPSLWA